MLRRSFNLFAVAVLSLGATLAHATDWKAGEHYTVLKQPVPTADANKIEVVEAFGYSCPHCNAFEPMLHAWSQNLADDVTFENMPVVFGRSWEPLARAYYVPNCCPGSVCLARRHVPSERCCSCLRMALPPQFG